MKSLAVKYRPLSFEDVVEQDTIKMILKEQVETKTNKHAYLFTGGAGTGKTTCARIFANELNHGEGNPIEIDAASNNGVDDVRRIISEAKYKSIDSDYKIYIIDECHMLSTGAWNALLKLLEEPPATAIFLMCTTDPQKIPQTILSRVQRYDFQRISFEGIVRRLKYICDNEVEDSIKYDEESLEYISKIADGGMRDAITLLDKCISYNNVLNIDNITKALGVVNYTDYFNLLDNLVLNNREEAIKIIEEVYRSGKDLKQFIKQFLNFLIDCNKYTLYSNFDYVNIPQTYANRLNYQRDKLTYVTRRFANLDADLKYNQSPKSYIELYVLMME